MPATLSLTKRNEADVFLRPEALSSLLQQATICCESENKKEMNKKSDSEICGIPFRESWATAPILAGAMVTNVAQCSLLALIGKGMCAYAFFEHLLCVCFRVLMCMCVCTCVCVYVCVEGPCVSQGSG